MTLISVGYLLLAIDGDRFRHPIIHVSEISARCSVLHTDVEQVICELLCTLVIYLWLHTDVNSYRIRSIVVAQECPRIDGVRRLMAYSKLCFCRNNTGRELNPAPATTKLTHTSGGYQLAFSAEKQTVVTL